MPDPEFMTEKVLSATSDETRLLRSVAVPSNIPSTALRRAVACESANWHCKISTLPYHDMLIANTAKIIRVPDNTDSHSNSSSTGCSYCTIKQGIHSVNQRQAAAQQQQTADSC